MNREEYIDWFYTQDSIVQKRILYKLELNDIRHTKIKDIIQIQIGDNNDKKIL